MDSKYYIIIVFLIVFLLLTYYFSYRYRTQSQINSLEITFQDHVNKQSYDFCANTQRNLSEYYVCSSHLPYLTGFKKYDYSSIDYLAQVIQYGSRFIYIEIYEKHNKPIISSGNEYGTIIEAQNGIDVGKCFEFLSKNVFSETFVDNYKDPFFVFMDFRCSDAIQKQVEETVRTICGMHLYQDFERNIARTPMCKLTQKMVLFSNRKINNLIHLSTQSSYLKVLKINQIPTKEFMASSRDKPDISLTSRQISITKKGLFIEDATDFIELGLNKDSVVKIVGSSKNFDENEFYDIKRVTNKNIYLQDDIKLDNESSGNPIQLKIYNKSYKLKNLAQTNKNALTIVIPEFEFLKLNYNPYDAWNLGCQFVCLNFQNIDSNMKTYMTKFKKTSIEIKPQHLINYKPPKRVPNINNVAQPVKGLDYPIIPDFHNTHSNIQLVPKLFDRIRAIVKDNTLILSRSFTNDNSFFEIVKGLSGVYGSISVKYGDQYLTSNDTCCYLSFQYNDKIKDHNHASFFPVEALVPGENTISLLQLIDSKEYYLKHRMNFNYKNQLYVKSTMSYERIATIGNYTVWNPIKENNYKPYCQVITEGTNPPNYESILVNGACAPPIDYQIIHKDTEGFSIWKPVAPEGFVAMGHLVMPTHSKPKLNDYNTVAYVFTTPATINSDPIFETDTLSFWSKTGDDYFIVNVGSFKPSSFTYPVVNIKTRPLDLTERLYISSVKSDEADSACFKIINESIKQPDPNRDYTEIMESKVSSQIVSKNTNKSITLSNDIWSNPEESALILKDKTHMDFMSNSFAYTNDGSIRFKSNINLGLGLKNADTIGLTNNPLLFVYEQEGILRDTKSQKCLGETKSDTLVLNESCDTYWNINTDVSNYCYKVGTIVFVKQLIPRALSNSFTSKKDYTGTNNFLGNYVNDTHFTAYIKGKITKIDSETTTMNVQFFHNNHVEELPLSTTNCFINQHAIPKQAQLGNTVLASNGTIIGSNIDPSNIRFMATVVKIIDSSQVALLFDINSIEANLNKPSKGRPRENLEIIQNINTLIPMVSSITC